MSEPNFIAGGQCLDFVSSVEAIIKRSCIIDYGIVQDVPADGIVDVSVAVSDTAQNMFYMTCVLANIASSSVAIDVKPNIGDRVLVVYPRIYDEKMFTVSDDNKKKREIIVNEQAKGYNLLSGIAILLNQCKKASHKNVIKFDDGKLDIKLAYDKNSNKNLLNISTDKNGAISLSNDNCELEIDKDGYLSYKNKKDNKTELSFTSSGAKIQDSNGCKIEMSSSFTTINGNLKVRNS